MHKNIFGTDGIRCRMNSSYLTEENLSNLGQAIAAWAPSKSRFVFGSDSRSSCKKIQAILSRELYKKNHSIIDAGIIPTPFLCRMVEEKKEYDFGIMITASHNPATDNGIKIVTQTQKISYFDELKISELFWNVSELLDSPFEEKEALNLNHLEIKLNYLDKIKKHLTYQKFDGFKIVIDCAQGATSFFAPDIFTSFGFEVVAINNAPDGKNINRDSGALYPEKLIQAVLESEADYGCAFDGDGDRILIVTSQGIILNGDDLLAIFAQHPRYAEESFFVGTTMSNQAVEQFFKNKNRAFIRTEVGDKYIAAELTQKKSLLGAEPSGHIIIKDHSFCSDGIFAALLFFDTLLACPDLPVPLFKAYPTAIKNISVIEKKDLKSSELAKLIETYEKKITPGRLIVRYSGTEPLLRVSIEHAKKEFAEEMLVNLVDELKTYLNL
jgi:phosphoglucosamine mutase